jgi:hypothetical protein
MSDDLTSDEIHDRIAWLKGRAREGADALHARAATPDRAPKLTDAESAAIARAKIDRSQP